MKKPFVPPVNDGKRQKAERREGGDRRPLSSVSKPTFQSGGEVFAKFKGVLGDRLGGGYSNLGRLHGDLNFNNCQ